MTGIQTKVLTLVNPALYQLAIPLLEFNSGYPFIVIVLTSYAGLPICLTRMTLIGILAGALQPSGMRPK